MWKSKRIHILFINRFYLWYNKFKEQNDWIEKTDSAYQLQIKAQKAAEEAMNHLQFYMTEEDKFVFKLIYYLIKSNLFIYRNLI